MYKKISFIFIIFFFFVPKFSIKNLKKNKTKQIINIAFGISNNYAKKILVPLISILENSSNNTIYHIYILVGKDFEEKNKIKIFQLEKIYFNCFIHFKNLGKEFQGVYTSFLDISIYYRLKLPEICNNLNRIIYLDGDTIILRDLLELFSLNFEGNYIMGRLDKYPDELDRLGIYIKNNINSGVLLMDLFNLRKYKYVDDFMNYIKEHNDEVYLHAHDQTLINYVCHDKIGILKPVFHMWPYPNASQFLKEHRNLRIPYDPKDVEYGFKYPFIVHFPGGFKKSNSTKDTIYFKRYYEYLNISEKMIK